VISARQLAANRLNAQRSVGPRSPRGKARASVNARRHGLSVPAIADPRLDSEVRELAQRIAGTRADPSYQALSVAHAQIDLERVRRLRHDWIATALRDLTQAADREADKVGDVLEDILGILRTIKSGPNSASPTVARLEQITALRRASRARRKGVDHTAMIGALARLDRYERLCLSRRKTAIRALDGRI
jgi:hypothetical protein